MWKIRLFLIVNLLYGYTRILISAQSDIDAPRSKRQPQYIEYWQEALNDGEDCYDRKLPNMPPKISPRDDDYAPNVQSVRHFKAPNGIAYNVYNLPAAPQQLRHYENFVYCDENTIDNAPAGRGTLTAATPNVGSVALSHAPRRPFRNKFDDLHDNAGKHKLNQQSKDNSQFCQEENFKTKANGHENLPLVGNSQHVKNHKADESASSEHEIDCIKWIVKKKPKLNIASKKELSEKKPNKTKNNTKNNNNKDNSKKPLPGKKQQQTKNNNKTKKQNNNKQSNDKKLHNQKQSHQNGNNSTLSSMHTINDSTNRTKQMNSFQNEFSSTQHKADSTRPKHHHIAVNIQIDNNDVDDDHDDHDDEEDGHSSSTFVNTTHNSSMHNTTTKQDASESRAEPQVLGTNNYNCFTKPDKKNLTPASKKAYHEPIAYEANHFQKCLKIDNRSPKLNRFEESDSGLGQSYDGNPTRFYSNNNQNNPPGNNRQGNIVRGSFAQSPVEVTYGNDNGNGNKNGNDIGNNRRYRKPTGRRPLRPYPKKPRKRPDDYCNDSVSIEVFGSKGTQLGQAQPIVESSFDEGENEFEGNLGSGYFNPYADEYGKAYHPISCESEESAEKRNYYRGGKTPSQYIT